MARLGQFGAAVGAVVAVLGSFLFISWKYFYNKRRFFEENKIIKEHPHPREKQILVLGLDGAGKTSILNSLASCNVKRKTSPTQGFNAVCIHTGGFKLDFLEIGGNYNLRSYWNLYLSKAHLLIYVVDSTDQERLSLAGQELRQLLRKDPSLPLVLLANKQDLAGAVSIYDLQKKLQVQDMKHERKLFLMATNVSDDGTKISESICDVKDLITQLILQKI